MKTIIGFDSWTEGARYFERLVPMLENNGYRLILIHIGSWGHDTNRPKEETIGRLTVRDISYYGNKNSLEIFEQENPSAIIFMSTRSLAHMAFNRYAQYKKIPTCHIYHGLVMVQAFGIGEMGYKINYIHHLILLATRAKKNIFKIIPFYIKSLYLTRSTLNDWLKLVDYIFHRGFGTSRKTEPYINDTSTDIGCVYTESDVEHMYRNYRIPQKNIHVVGNPDLTTFDVKEKDIGFALSRSYNCDTILYIDTALIEASAVFNSATEFIQHILITQDKLKSLGFKFIVKLHPAHYKTGISSLLIESGVKLCSNLDFIRELKSSIAVIAEPSTAAVIPALLGIPVLLAQYGKLSMQEYGNVLRSYPRSRYLNDLTEIRTILSSELNSLSIANVTKWIEINSGPLPAEDMPKRSVQALLELITQKNKINNNYAIKKC